MASRTLPARTSAVSCSTRPSSLLITSSNSSASLRASAGVVIRGRGAGACLACGCWFMRFPSGIWFEHDLFGKPLHTFPDHALAAVRLLQDQRAEHLVGNSDATGLGE